MTLTVSVVKDGRVLASKVISDPQPGDVEKAIHEVLDQARRDAGGAPLWPFEITVR